MIDKAKLFRWYYVTRLLGVVGFVYALLIDATGDRATVIVASAGLLGLDRVARSEVGGDDVPRG